LIPSGSQLSRSLAIELFHPVPKPGWASEQDVREHESGERDREGRCVRDDDERCPDETVSETHAYLTIPSDRRKFSRLRAKQARR
jgi:hypothetical protein